MIARDRCDAREDRPGRASLPKRQLLIATLVIAGLIASAAFMNDKYRICKNDAAAEALNGYEAMANDNIEDMNIALDTLAETFETPDQWTQEQTVQLLKAAQVKHGFDFVVKTESDGYAVNMNGKTQIYLGDRPYFLAGMQGEVTTSFINQGRVDASSSFILSAVFIKVNGRATGIVHGSYSADNYFGNISRSSALSDEWMMLMGSDGAIAASLGGEEYVSCLADFGLDEYERARIESAMANGESGTFGCTVDGVERIAAFSSADFFQSDLSLVLAMRADRVDIDTNQFLRMILPVLVINGFVFASVVFYCFYRFNRRRDELEIATASNKAKMEFLSTMSHDLRTPLNTVINMTTLAYDDIGNTPKLRDDLSKIELAGNFMLGLIKDVLDVSRIESGKLVLSPQLYRFAEFKNYIDGIIVPLCESKGMRFVSEYHVMHKAVLVDPIRFNQVFFNVLSNAVKYSEEGTEILFRIEETGMARKSALVRFTIKDQGIGMSEDFRQKLFQPFERENTSDAFAGTGLGMYISKQIVSCMNGSIEVLSTRDEGTEVTVVLPLPVEEKPVARSKESSEERAPAHVSGKVLVVDDHPLNREIIVRLLKKKGYDADEVEDGLQALRRFEAGADGEYMAILMDVRMPVMDGLTAAASIRALPGAYAKNVLIIATSANAFEEDKRKSKEAGMDAHLAKPVVPDELYEALLMRDHS